MDYSLSGFSVYRSFQARMGWHFLLQGIFMTQGSTPRLLCLLHWQAVFNHCTIWEALTYRWPLLVSYIVLIRNFLSIFKSTHVFCTHVFYFFCLDECIFCKFLCPFSFSLNIAYTYFHINIYINSIISLFIFGFFFFFGLCCCAKTVVVWL